MDRGGALRDRGLHVEHGIERGDVDLDRFGGVLGLRRTAGHDDGHDLAREVDLVNGDRDMPRGRDIRSHRSAARDGRLLGVEVGAGVDGDDARHLLGRRHVDALDRAVRDGAADHRDVQHAV